MYDSTDLSNPTELVTLSLGEMSPEGSVRKECDSMCVISFDLRKAKPILSVKT